MSKTMLQRRKKITSKKRQKVASALALLLTVNLTAYAMDDAVYSYTVEYGEVNLMSATLPYDMETLNIPSEIDGMPVESIDGCFVLYQEHEKIYTDIRGENPHRIAPIVRNGYRPLEYNLKPY